MRPKDRRDTGQTDLLRSRLDAIIDMAHPLVKLAQTIDWSFLEERFGAVYEDKPGRPPLPTRLMAVLEELLAAEELVIGVLHPALAQDLVGEVVSVLEDRKPRH